MKCLFTLFVPIFLSVGVYGQYSLKKFDINTSYPNAYSNPSGFSKFNGKVYFFASDGLHGYELWDIDNDSAALTADIWLGSSSSAYVSFDDMPVLGNKMYFIASNAGSWQLFEFDGINSPAVVSFPPDIITEMSAMNNLTVLNGKLYFAAVLYPGGREQVYSYDPVFENTIKLTQTSSTISTIRGIIPFSDLIVFSAVDSAKGTELFIYDTKKKQTYTYDINPGSGGSIPFGYLVNKNKMFFTAYTPDFGRELYVLDILGVRRLTDVNPGPGSSFKNATAELCVFQDHVCFMATADSAQYNLYKYNIASEKLSIFHEVDNKYLYYYIPTNPNFAIYGGKLFYGIDSANTGLSHMFIYDGTNPPYDLSKVVSNHAVTLPRNMKVCGGKLYFAGNNMNGQDEEPYILTDSAALDIKGNSIADADVSIHPNPASEEITLSMTLKKPERLAIRLADMQGKIVYTAVPEYYPAATHKIILPVQDLPAGNYVYLISNVKGNILHSGTLVKQ